MKSGSTKYLARAGKENGAIKLFHLNTSDTLDNKYLHSEEKNSSNCSVGISFLDRK